MSGIIGILHLDQTPVERHLLQRLTDFQAFRGPDAQEIWLDRHVGFGHTLLRTTEESNHEKQPFTLDGRVWIVADARVDGRRDLISQLQARGHEDLAATAPDVELILRAYLAWGEGCVERLLGDFAFGIWDGPQRRLFCARDQMGIKPFYYAHVGSCVIFSNTLNCIRQHPCISDRLNDLAVADFLLCEGNQDPATTTFAEIQRLPPAHRATWTDGGLSLGRYWSLPIEEPIFYRRAGDYVDRFQELLRQALDDRLRTNRAGVFMSGGLDSPTLAAVARDRLQERFGQFYLQALTRTDVIDPEESHYAGMVASHLGIPIHYYERSTAATHSSWEQESFQTPEPDDTPWDLPSRRSYWQLVESLGKVFLFGEGPDNALFWEWRPYVSYLLRKRHWGRLAQGICSTLIAQRRPPFWGRISNGVRGWKSGGSPETTPTFPVWVNPRLAARLDLHARWHNFWYSAPINHPLRPKAYRSLQIPLWQAIFEFMDPGRTRVGVEVRHPFVDVRLLQFLLAIPALPWCRSKYLLRRSMRGVLPDPVLNRRKSGLAVAPLLERVKHFASVPLVPVPDLGYYIDTALVSATPSSDLWVLGSDLRVRTLNHWLRSSWLQNSANRLQNVVEEES